MNRNICVFFLILLSVSLGSSQKKETLEQKVMRLEKSLDSLRNVTRFHTYIYNHNDIEESKYNSLLALRLNRNFTYSAHFYEGQADTKDGKGYQRIFYFIGYRLAEDTRKRIANDKSAFLSSIRGNLKEIRSIVVGDNISPPDQTAEYKIYPNRLVITYYDNAGSSEELIIADTYLNSLKVRIDGVMQEVGWE